MHRRILYQLTWLAAAMSLGHHLDHLIRGNAVGWPLTEEVNAFTASLVVYPIIATGLLLYHAGRVGPGFWALVSGGGAAFVAAVHFGPAAVEPPELILDHYRPPILGWLAFAWLVAFVAVLAITSVYETRLWAQQRQARRATRPATGREARDDRHQPSRCWGRAAGRPAQPSAAAVAGGVGGAALLVATRVPLWLGCSCCWPASWSWAGLSPSGGRSTRRPAGGWVRLGSTLTAIGACHERFGGSQVGSAAGYLAYVPRG